MTLVTNEDLSAVRPEKSLVTRKLRTGGRTNSGRATSNNIGGGHKKLYRIIDFRRNKLDIAGKVATIEYDPNRSARIALIQYVDGEKRYILAPVGVKVGDVVMSGEKVEVKPGNALPLKNIPVGQFIHNIEINRGGGGQLVRSAGVSAQLMAKEDNYVQIRMPSGEMRKVFEECFATIGQLSNPDHQNVSVGKAGRSRWLGIRPKNRGNARNPCDHPLGGGEGRTKGGRHPCSRTGLLAKGLKTRSNKRTDKFILRRRTQKVESV